jgi:hypothetical protein
MLRSVATTRAIPRLAPGLPFFGSSFKPNSAQLRKLSNSAKSAKSAESAKGATGATGTIGATGEESASQITINFNLPQFIIRPVGFYKDSYKYWRNTEEIGSNWKKTPKFYKTVGEAVAYSGALIGFFGGCYFYYDTIRSNHSREFRRVNLAFMGSCGVIGGFVGSVFAVPFGLYWPVLLTPAIIFGALSQVNYVPEYKDRRYSDY